jgi:hypothetical protein
VVAVAVKAGRLVLVDAGFHSSIVILVVGACNGRSAR